MDAELEEKVAQWKAAKESKDWSTADSLRAELREAGFDPDKPRQRNAQDPELELKLHQWQTAKQNKDFDTADAIREELRAKGVEPDAPRGKGGSSNHESSFLPGFMAPFMSPMASFMTPHSDWRPYDASVEIDLDQWVEAKHSKDFSTADSIRASLRERGHSPAKERPLNGGAQEEVAQWTRAKKAKDYARSDRIRESLRAQGVDPEKFNEAAAAASFFPPMWGGKGQAAPMTAKRGSSNKPKPSLGSMDSVTIEELNQWFDAKEQKNFRVADAIRDTLRAKGVEPAHCQKPGSAGLDVTMEAELQEWFEARDAKDFATADRIREGLRAKGVEPSQCQRPDGDASGATYGKTGPASRGGARSTPYAAGRGGGASGGTLDRATEAQLDEWWKHKQDKNYGLADGIRNELREQGIEPEQHRPRK